MDRLNYLAFIKILRDVLLYYSSGWASEGVK